MRKVVITSNMLNEANNYLDEWIDNMKQLTDTGIIVVDGGSIDGTKEVLEINDIIVVTDNIIQREGYGPARNQLRELAKQYFPDAHWECHFDCDERIDPSDFHKFRWLKDYLNECYYDVIGFPRIDWYDRDKIKSANNIRINPDFQARMSRLSCSVRYEKACHEQVVPTKGIYLNVDTCPVIQHFHRSAPKEKRDQVGRLCSFLHRKDDEAGIKYPKHHKEDMYYQKYLEEGL